MTQSVRPLAFIWMFSRLLVSTLVFIDIFYGSHVTQLMFHRKNLVSTFVACSWLMLVSDWVFPSSLPRGLHLSQSYSVSDMGVVGVRSSMTTPANLVIMDTALCCN